MGSQLAGWAMGLSVRLSSLVVSAPVCWAPDATLVLLSFGSPREDIVGDGRSYLS